MSNFTAGQASDPSTPLETLAQIAHERADLRAAVAANPSSYPGLLEWLKALDDPEVNAALAARVANGADGAATDAPAVPEPPAATEPPAPPEPPAVPGPVAGPPGYGAAAPVGYGNASAPGPQQPLSGEQPKRKRTGLIVTAVVAAVVVLGVGGFLLANQLFFSKIKPAKAPDEAVTKLLDAVSAKDVLSIYGAVSPAEFKQVRAQYEAFNDKLRDNGLGEYEDLNKDLIDAITIDISDVQLEVEEVEPGLAKVRITSGALKLDADKDKLTGAVVGLANELQSAPLFSSLFGQELDFAELETRVRESLDQDLPQTVDVKKDLDDNAFLMAVEEDGGWYVSPYLTYGEYMFIEGAGQSSERGKLPEAEIVKTYDSPDAAVAGAAEATLNFLDSGDTNLLVGSLPLAERRFIALYGNMDIPVSGNSGAKITSNEFNVRSTDRDLAYVTFKDFGFEVQEGFKTVGLFFRGACLYGTDSRDGDGEFCVDQAPLVKELNLQELAFVTVKEDGSWFLSPTSTIADASLVVGINVLKLIDDGRFKDESWLQEQWRALEDYAAEKMGPMYPTGSMNLGGSYPGDPLDSVEDPFSTWDDNSFDF